MGSIGGTIIVSDSVRNAECLRASVHSLLSFCSEVVAFDLGSEDGSIGILKDIASRYKELRIVEDAHRFYGPAARLCSMTDRARLMLHTDWHFVLRPYEVVHESSLSYIREAVDQNKHESVYCKRMSFFDDVLLMTDYYVKFAKTQTFAVGDGNYLNPIGAGKEYRDKIVVYDYSPMTLSKHVTEYAAIGDGSIKTDSAEAPVHVKEWLYRRRFGIDPEMAEMYCSD